MTSGGPASFIMPLQIGKTPIVMPRQHQFNEHVNDHQVEFARNVAQRMGTIIPVEDGVICGYIDPCQRPYQQICDALDLPCYGTKDQFFYMTDKHAFKKMCMENGVDVIPEYTEEEALSGQAEFPLFVKPVDSRGSRGQSVCYTTEQLENAINFAKSE